MAHPLTQLPPSPLPFPSAARPSPLSWSFGNPPPSSSSTSNNRPNVPTFPSSPHAFGSLTKRVASRPSPYQTKPDTTLKRSRKSSSSSDSTPSSPISNSSPRQPLSELPKGKEKDELSVGELMLKDDGDRRIAGRKLFKRSRPDQTVLQVTESQMDLGVLLATLPPSAHLPILLNLLKSHPQLNGEVMSSLPEPDLQECLEQLDRLMTRVRAKAGLPSAALDQGRAWSRAEKDVSNWVRTASTYLSFFTSPSDRSRSSVDAQTIQSLLSALTSSMYTFLSMIPSNMDETFGTVKALLQLGQAIVASWITWVGVISSEVNQRGGMFPYSSVNTWADNLDKYASPPADSASGFAWTSSWSSTQVSTQIQPLVDSFSTALTSVRDRFNADVGWLIGRQSSSSLPTGSRPLQSSMIPQVHQWSRMTRPLSMGIAGAQDEEV